MLAAYTYLGLTCFIIQIILIPESPKFLLINGRKKEAITALNRIGQLNRSNFEFDENDHFIEEELAKVDEAGIQVELQKHKKENQDESLSHRSIST